jgi:hypothetical protein
MTKTLLGRILLLLLTSVCIAPMAQAASIKECGARGPSKSNGEYDHFRDAKIEAAAGRGQVFANNEGILPGAGKNQSYYEYDLGADGFGGRGAHRAVLLVQKRAVSKSYFTQDHYASFCKI